MTIPAQTSGTPARTSEDRILEAARRYSFRARMDKGRFEGPVFVRGAGSEVEDVNGKRYLDFNSGQMCAWLGHNQPTITAAVAEACDTLVHAHSSYFNDKEVELAERLAAIMPPPLEKSLFLQSGADANEAAVNIARKYTGGFEVASPHISFHGMSDSTRARTYAGWHAGYGPPAAGAMPMVAPYCYRCPLRQTFPRLRIRLPRYELRADRRPDHQPSGGGHHGADLQRRRRGRTARGLARRAAAALPCARDAAHPR